MGDEHYHPGQCACRALPDGNVHLCWWAANYNDQHRGVISRLMYLAGARCLATDLARSHVRAALKLQAHGFKAQDQHGDGRSHARKLVCR